MEVEVKVVVSPLLEIVHACAFVSTKISPFSVA